MTENSFREGTWGDIGNGYFKNPVINADYSDPDVIRVKNDFYMVCSEFHFMGMPVLHSKDLVNWTIIGQVYNRLNIDIKYDNMDGYGKGSWAPALRYHNELFYVFFCTPGEGLYMSTAENPGGPWSPIHEVKRVERWEDPCPFWDDDGTAYLGHSKVGAGPIIIHKMSPDGRTLLDEGVTVYTGPVAEGTKIYKRNGFYYLSIPEGGVTNGWQTVLRSKNIYGPYERKIVLEQGSTNINGPHQGALVELESGETWFMHFQDAGTIGRVCHLQPAIWIEDWPLIGYGGEPVLICDKPDVGTEYPICTPQTSDDFNDSALGYQWQWNHNPFDSGWSLEERPGFLRIKAFPAADVLHARNTLTQKLMGERGTAVLRLSSENMNAGQTAGLVHLGSERPNWIGVVKDESRCRISSCIQGISYSGPVINDSAVWFRTDIDLKGSTYLSYSFNGIDFIRFGCECKLKNGFWKGSRLGLFTYGNSGGYADFDWFRYEYEGPYRRC